MKNFYYSSITVQMTETIGEYLSVSSTVVPYAGGWAECKGDNSQNEMDRANQLQAQQQQLMQQQLQMEMGQINQVNSVLDPIIRAGGMSPQEQAAMQSLAINQLPQDFRNTEQSINTNLLRRGVTGGNMAGSGDISRNFGQLGAMEDYMKGTMLSNIQVQKANQLRQALGMKMGIGGMFGQNAGMFNQGSLNSLGMGVNAANNADQAQTGWLGPILGAFGSIGGGFMQGYGSTFGGKKSG